MSAKPSPHEREAAGRFIELCLEETLGGVRPPDLAARVAEAGPDARRRAAEALQGATLDAGDTAARALGLDGGSGASAWSPPPAQGRVARRVALLAAAALALFALGAALRDRRDGADEPAPGSVAESAPGQDEAASFQALIDRFHAAMPVEPVRLRDAAVRQRHARAVVPVLRELIAFCESRHEDTAEQPLGVEFEVYALALGDTGVAADLARREANGDGAARDARLVAALIDAEDASERADALAAFLDRLQRLGPLSPAVARTLVAADLDEEELARVLDALSPGPVAALVEHMCNRARVHPRRWIGSRVEFAGRSAGGAPTSLVSTSAWTKDAGVVVFWASWCGPSHAMLAALEAARESYGPRALDVLGVSCDLEASELEAHLARHARQDWPQLFDPDAPGWHALAHALDVRWVPTAFVLDRDGVVLDVVSTPEDLLHALARALGTRR